MSGVFLDANSGWHQKSETVLGFKSAQGIGGRGQETEPVSSVILPIHIHTCFSIEKERFPTLRVQCILFKILWQLTISEGELYLNISVTFKLFNEILFQCINNDEFKDMVLIHVIS